MRSIQAPSAVVMIRPHRFHPNPETAADNAFQRSSGEASAAAISHAARDEVTAAAAALEAAGVRVHVFDDFGERETPDSVFPNNWFSTHRGGHVALFPMALSSRRRERRADVIGMLKAEYRVQDVIDYSGLEHSPQVRSSLPERAFAEPIFVFVEKHSRWQRGRRCPVGAICVAMRSTGPRSARTARIHI